MTDIMDSLIFLSWMRAPWQLVAGEETLRLEQAEDVKKKLLIKRHPVFFVAPEFCHALIAAGDPLVAAKEIDEHFKPRPSAIVVTTGGVICLWRTREAHLGPGLHYLDGVSEIAAMNVLLTKKLEGDATACAVGHPLPLPGSGSYALVLR